MRLNPHHPERFWSHLDAHTSSAGTLRQGDRGLRAHGHLRCPAARLPRLYAWLGDKTASAAHVARMRELDRELDLEKFLATMHYARAEDLQHLKEGLQKAGF